MAAEARPSMPLSANRVPSGSSLLFRSLLTPPALLETKGDHSVLEVLYQLCPGDLCSWCPSM